MSKVVVANVFQILFKKYKTKYTLKSSNKYLIPFKKSITFLRRRVEYIHQSYSPCCLKILRRTRKNIPGTANI